MGKMNRLRRVWNVRPRIKSCGDVMLYRFAYSGIMLESRIFEFFLSFGHATMSASDEVRDS
jgi:hypothetical protein